MMKLTKTGIGLLTRLYRSVLHKCFLINAGLFFALAPSAADADMVIGNLPEQSSTSNEDVGASWIYNNHRLRTVKNNATIADNLKYLDHLVGYYWWQDPSAEPSLYVGAPNYLRENYAITSQLYFLDQAIETKQPVINASNKLSSSYISGLATVATSGSYSDLSNKPTIGKSNLYIKNASGTTKATFGANATSNVTATFANVAFSGSYSDLTGTPTIGEALLKITSGGTETSFSANATTGINLNLDNNYYTNVEFSMAKNPVKAANDNNFTTLNCVKEA